MGTTKRNIKGAKPVNTGKAVASSNSSRIELLGKYTPWLLFAFAIILYFNTLNYGYVLDDGMMIKENKYTLQGFSGIGNILTHDAFAGLSGGDDNGIYQGGRYRPLSQVTFAIEYAIFKLNPFVGHLINILMYGFLAMLIYYLLESLFKNYGKRQWYASIPFIASAIFIAHPLHTEVVANIKSRDEIMGMLFGVLMLLFSLKYLEKKKMLYLGLSFLFFMLALFSKESCITFLAVVPLTIFVFRKATLKEHAIIIAPALFAMVLYFIIRLAVIGNTSGHAVVAELFHNPFRDASFAERYATVAYTWLKYLILLVFPNSLTHDYYARQVPIIGWADARAILSVLIYLTIIGFAMISILKKNIVAYGILFFLITFSVTSNLFFDLGLFMNERFMFTPLLGFALIAAYFFQRIKAHKILTYVFLLLMLLYSVKTISRNTAWKSDLILFTTDVQTSTNSGRCNVIAGSMILNKAREIIDTATQHEQYLLAEEYLNRGVTIYDENSDGWNCLGEVQIYLNRFEEAVKSLKRVFKYDPVSPNALRNLLYIGSKYDEKMQFEKALKVYKFLDKQNPKDLAYKYNMAYDYINLNKTDSAFIVLENVIKAKPDYYDAYNRIAEYYAQYRNDYAQSIKYLELAYERNPEYPKTLENFGVVYGIKADYQKSLFYFTKAYRLDSTSAKLCRNMGKTYEALGNKIKANEFYTKAGKYPQDK